MVTKMLLNSEQVLAVASRIESDNLQLQQLLNDSKVAIDGLGGNWTGAAADQTRASYDTFATQCFQTYFDVLDQYVKFLRDNVAEQYTQVENTNTRLADTFK